MRGYGFLKYYNGCRILNMPDCFVATNKYGTTIGQSKTLSGIEYLIDEYMAKEGK